MIAYHTLHPNDFAHMKVQFFFKHSWRFLSICENMNREHFQYCSTIDTTSDFDNHKNHNIKAEQKITWTILTFVCILFYWDSLFSSKILLKLWAAFIATNFALATGGRCGKQQLHHLSSTTTAGQYTSSSRTEGHKSRRRGRLDSSFCSTKARRKRKNK